ncbi:glycosyltransferase [Bacteroides sp. AN502(2024)]|uniref:glycosyltransferase n=1 Tax=Bacteroides sp. AN502(2024) TaxID=3160599 RepID=UPI003511947B
MKKILFILPYYKIGGTLTSFANLIPLIDKKVYEIDVFALTNDVDDVAILPKGVNYLEVNMGAPNVVAVQKRMKSKVVRFLKSGKRLLVKFGYDLSDIVFKKMAKSLSGKYDVVIAFQEGQPTRMAQYISAPEKIAWVHCIYSRFKSMANDSVFAAYNRFDKIVCVSYTAAKDLIVCEPQWKEKIHVVYNVVNTSKVNTMASMGKLFEKKINLVSIGRIDPVKRFSYIPAIARKLKELGFEFDWRIIGGIAVQEEHDKLIGNISDCKVDDCVHPIGVQSNPYPYIKSSDLLVCLSSSETFNYTIAEAKAIGTPVVTTDFPCAFEFVEHEKTGLILPIEQIADGIKRMLTDKALYLDMQNRLIANKKTAIYYKEQLESLL